MLKQYKRVKNAVNEFRIITPDGVFIYNHRGKLFPVLSENISRNLCDDLNDIKKQNHKFFAKSGKNRDRLTDTFTGEDCDNEMRESLAYCVISTMMESPNAQFRIELNKLIQWDRIFRLNPQPPRLLLELGILERVKNILKFHWVNLQLNYCSTIKEMHEQNIDFVPAAIIQELRPFARRMMPVEKFICLLVFHYLGRFSITFSILWVAGKINEDYLVDAYWIFVFGENPRELKEKEYEKVRFLKNRLLFLKTIKWSNQWKDEFLPK